MIVKNVLLCLLLGAVLGFLAALCIGCTVTAYRSPRGETIIAASLLSDKTVSSVRLASSSNGSSCAELRGSTNHVSSVCGAIAGADIKALVP